MTLLPSLAERARNMGWGPTIAEPTSVKDAETYIMNVYADTHLDVVARMMWFSKALRETHPALLPEYINGLMEHAGKDTGSCTLGMIYAFKYLEWLYEDAHRQAGNVQLTLIRSAHS
jgi:hypothetical protein